MHSNKEKRSTKSGFTLLELLVVLSILAIVGGGLLVAYDSMDDKAAEGMAAHTLASLDSAVRTHIAAEGGLIPNEMDSLIAADYPGSAGNVVSSSENPAKVAILSSKIISKTLDINFLTQEQFNAFEAAGLTHVRYVDNKGNDPGAPPPVQLDVPDANGNQGEVGALYDIDIPHRVFETPRPGSGRNRGRGFESLLAVGSPVLQWDPNRDGTDIGGGYDNTKLGAEPDDVLLVFGLGNDCSMVGAGLGDAQLSSAPVFGKRFNKWEYGRYYIVVNVGPVADTFAKARVQCVMNSHGDFVDEMISEYIGQKN